jgi:hypothetical protein
LRKKIFIKCILMIFVLTMTACSGLRFSQLAPDVKSFHPCSELRFSQPAPEAKDFHPQKVAVFPVEMINSEETKGAKSVMEQIVADSFIEKKWLPNIMDTASLNKQLLANKELNEAMAEYLSKLRTVNFSDPDLSKKIGELTKIDAFLLVSLDVWDYTVEKEKNMANVGMNMSLYEASTGKLIWKAGHAITESYIFIMPDLSKVARDVTREMIVCMPH